MCCCCKYAKNFNRSCLKGWGFWEHPFYSFDARSSLLYQNSLTVFWGTKVLFCVYWMFLPVISITNAAGVYNLFAMVNVLQNVRPFILYTTIGAFILLLLWKTNLFEKEIWVCEALYDTLAWSSTFFLYNFEKHIYLQETLLID